MTAPRPTNDGSRNAPALRCDLNLGTLSEPPAWSTQPRAEGRALLEAIKAAGYQGVQGNDPALCREIGLGCTGGGRVNKPGEIAPLAAKWKQAGYEACTLHVGWGHEDDAAADQLVREIIKASLDEDLPLYIETHRATITQDTWRTVRLIERNPDVCINADFSHWYTGLEMVYGDFEAKLTFLQPVFDRVRFFHGRCGNSGCIQMPLDHPSMPRALGHFREMWTRSFQGFLAAAGPGDFISFNPEILHPSINYAPVSRQADGTYAEASDRWVDAQTMTTMAKECFAEAQRRQAGAAAAR